MLVEWLWLVGGEEKRSKGPASTQAQCGDLAAGSDWLAAAAVGCGCLATISSLSADRRRVETESSERASANFLSVQPTNRSSPYSTTPLKAASSSSQLDT